MYSRASDTTSQAELGDEKMLALRLLHRYGGSGNPAVGPGAVSGRQFFPWCTGGAAKEGPRKTPRLSVAEIEGTPTETEGTRRRSDMRFQVSQRAKGMNFVPYNPPLDQTRA